MVYKLLLDQITPLVALYDPNASLTFLEAFTWEIVNIPGGFYLGMEQAFS